VVRIFAWRTTLAVVLLFATTPLLDAQILGRNKIHYRDFEWRVLSGEHVDLYFYTEGDELARVALAYSEESFHFLEAKFGHSPTRRVPLITYASHSDFEQTNLLPFVPPEGILGFTEFLRRRIALPFRGSYSQFRHTLRHELVHSFHHSMLAEVYRLHPKRVRPRFPLWWTEGLAEYWSEGEDSLDEMFLRALTVEGFLPSIETLNFLNSTIAYPLGGVLHRWLADNFGEWRVQELYHSAWKYRTFEEALVVTYGQSLDELNSRFQYFMRQRYFPSVAAREPFTVSATPVERLAIRPAVYEVEGEDLPRFLFLSPSSGYIDIVSKRWDGEDRTTVVRGERTAEFESFHPFASRMDVREGVVTFSSKYLDRDALFFWDLAEDKVVGRYQFPNLVSMFSPTWAPDGQSVVFTGLTFSGYSDLYRLNLGNGTIDQLTSDRFEDLDASFSPDGTKLVFASDRTVDGSEGAKNLFVLDIATGDLSHLTHGRWVDQTPRWADNGRIYYSSDMGGVFDIYSIDQDGMSRRETRTLTGAFDPQYVGSESSLMFAGFDERLSWTIYRQPVWEVSDTTEVVVALESDDESSDPWAWPGLGESEFSRSDPRPYEQQYSLDFAAAAGALTPGVGSSQGLLLLFSDLFSDNILATTFSSFQGDGIGGFVDNFSGSLAYLNRKNRLNWGGGVFRQRGLFLEGDNQSVFDERTYGGFLVARWPFDRFQRIETQFRLERSDRLDFFSGSALSPRRVGTIATNVVSYVKDNTLWLLTGPIDGQRTALTLSIANDLSNARFDSWTLALDARRYFRIGSQSTYAVRTVGYYASGQIPRRISVGGSLGLRGYPRRIGVSGTRTFMINQELRFPLTRFLTLGLPVGNLRFPSVQGAIFADIGGAWLPNSRNRALLGSAGTGFRMPIIFPLILRLDFGYRFDFGDISGYGLPPTTGRKFVDFFIGVNY
jgi:hypothetical protein